MFNFLFINFIKLFLILENHDYYKIVSNYILYNQKFGNCHYNCRKISIAKLHNKNIIIASFFGVIIIGESILFIS